VVIYSVVLRLLWRTSLYKILNTEIHKKENYIAYSCETEYLTLRWFLPIVLLNRNKFLWSVFLNRNVVLTDHKNLFVWFLTLRKEHWKSLWTQSSNQNIWISETKLWEGGRIHEREQHCNSHYCTSTVTVGMKWWNRKCIKYFDIEMVTAGMKWTDLNSLTTEPEIGLLCPWKWTLCDRVNEVDECLMPNNTATGY
jgi:hypothetical protein